MKNQKGEEACNSDEGSKNAGTTSTMIPMRIIIAPMYCPQAYLVLMTTYEQSIVIGMVICCNSCCVAPGIIEKKW